MPADPSLPIPFSNDAQSKWAFGYAVLNVSLFGCLTKFLSSCCVNGCWFDHDIPNAILAHRKNCHPDLPGIALDWATLHRNLRPHMVHIDWKGTNVYVDPRTDAQKSAALLADQRQASAGIKVSPAGSRSPPSVQEQLDMMAQEIRHLRDDLSRMDHIMERSGVYSAYKSQRILREIDLLQRELALDAREQATMGRQRCERRAGRPRRREERERHALDETGPNERLRRGERDRTWAYVTDWQQQNRPERSSSLGQVAQPAPRPAVNSRQVSSHPSRYPGGAGSNADSRGSSHSGYRRVRQPHHHRRRVSRSSSDHSIARYPASPLLPQLAVPFVPPYGLPPQYAQMPTYFPQPGYGQMMNGLPWSQMPVYSYMPQSFFPGHADPYQRRLHRGRSRRRR